MGLFRNDTEFPPAEAATEVGADDSREPSPVITGLLWALGLTALCLLAAHFLARVWP